MASFGPAGIPGGTWQARSAQGTQHGAGWEFLGNPYQEQALKLQKEGQEFGQDMANRKFGFQQQVFGAVAPYAQQMLAGLGGGRVGGQTAPQPQINTNPIFSPQQIQEQMNAAMSSNDQRTATLMRQLGGSAAARGFGGASPAIEAQRTQLGIANMGANAMAQREIPLQYAQPNADQAFRTDSLRQQQWAQGEDVDIRRRQSMQQLMSQLLGFYGNMAG